MTITIPPARAAMVDAQGMVTRPFYVFFGKMVDGLNASNAFDITDINVRLTKVEGEVSQGAGTIVGSSSIQSQGLLPGYVYITLNGDTDAPGNTQYYGSDSTGVRGWFDIASAIASTSDITLSVAITGITTVGLSDLADSGVGAALAKITRDSKGRIAGTQAATSDDLAEGSTNLYDAPVQAIALTALSYPNVVALDGAGNAYYPDLTNPADVSRIVGVTLHAAAMGAPVAITTSRDFTETAWAWLPGRIYCALSGGALTQTAPATGAVVEVARVISPTTIRVGIQPATLR